MLCWLFSDILGTIRPLFGLGPRCNSHITRSQLRFPGHFLIQRQKTALHWQSRPTNKLFAGWDVVVSGSLDPLCTVLRSLLCLEDCLSCHGTRGNDKLTPFMCFEYTLTVYICLYLVSLKELQAPGNNLGRNCDIIK